MHGKNHASFPQLVPWGDESRTRYPACTGVCAIGKEPPPPPLNMNLGGCIGEGPSEKGREICSQVS